MRDHTDAASDPMCGTRGLGGHGTIRTIRTIRGNFGWTRNFVRAGSVSLLFRQAGAEQLHPIQHRVRKPRMNLGADRPTTASRGATNGVTSRISDPGGPFVASGAFREVEE